MKIDVTRMVGELSPVPVLSGEAPALPRALAREPRAARLSATIRRARPLRDAFSACTRTLDRRAHVIPPEMPRPLLAEP